jgi:hypothetical protein
VAIDDRKDQGAGREVAANVPRILEAAEFRDFGKVSSRTRIARAAVKNAVVPPLK